MSPHNFRVSPFLIGLAFINPSPTITLESQGATVGEIVKLIGTQSGRNLVAGANIKSERIIVRMSNVPTNEAMKALAEQEVGKWIQSGDRTTFVKDVDGQNKKEKAEKDQLVQLWEHKLDRMQSKMGAESFTAQVASKLAVELSELTDRYHKGDLDDFVRLEEAGYELPAGRALVKVLTMIGAERLAQFPSGYTEFATSPGSLQQPIAQNSAAVLETFKAEQREWNDAQGRRPGKLGLSQGGGTPDDISTATGLILKLAAHGSGGVAVLVVYDRNGRILNQSVSTLSVDGVQAMHEEIKRDTQAAKTADWQDLSQVSRDLYRVRDERVKSEDVLQIWKDDKAFRDAVEHPETFDIDGIVLGQQVLAMARAKNLNLIVPEVSTLARFLPESAFKNGQINVNLLKNRLDFSMSPTEFTGWYLIRKTGKIADFESGQGGADPAHLGNFFRTCMRLDEIPLNQIAELYVGSKGLFGLGGSFGITSAVVNALKPDMPGWGWMNNRPMTLGFYGGLSAEQRQMAGTSGIALVSLTPENWEPLLRDPWMLEGAITIPKVSEGGAKSIYTDPFVFFGLTDSRIGSLRFEDSEEPTIGVDTDGYYSFQNQEEWTKRQKKGSERGNHEPKFRAANRRTIKIVFSFVNHAQMSLVLDCDDPVGPAVATYKELPQELRDRFPAPKKQ